MQRCVEVGRSRVCVDADHRGIHGTVAVLMVEPIDNPADGYRVELRYDEARQVAEWLVENAKARDIFA